LHACPWDFCVAHCPFAAQYSPATQSLSLPQLVSQVPVDELHSKPLGHGVAVAVGHTPCEQFTAGVIMFPEQLAAPHGPAGYVHCVALCDVHCPPQPVPAPVHCVRVAPWGPPTVTWVHCPKLLGMSQASHVSVHAELQQYPSTQLWFVHSADVVQVSPSPFVDRHAPPLQYGVDPVHCVSFMHAFEQAVPPALHVAGLHITVVAAGHAPAPLHAAASVWTPFEQLAGVHVVELLGYVQPSTFPIAHVPVHAAPAAPVHAGRIPCGVPVTAVHLPGEPGTSHAWHCPLHALSQQRPSTQYKPLAQTLPAPHAEPIAPPSEASDACAGELSPCVELSARGELSPD
jgi:hypothetical protein